jgi:pyridoxamine 5'-phosphate oxidase
LTSEQSKIISGRNILDEKFSELTKKYEGKIIPLPDNWGGYRIIPERIEFWQGRKNRLHDRILYTKENEEWKTERLYLKN